jgi:hypothetical protein
VVAYLIASDSTKDQKVMPCEEWCKLINRYRSATKTYSDAVDGLGSAPGIEFNLAWQRADRARKDCDATRAALLIHEHDHACLGERQPAGAQQGIEFKTEELTLGDQGQSGG